MTLSSIPTRDDWPASLQAGERPLQGVPDGWPNRLHSQFHKTADARWHVQRCGDGETIVLLHGTGSSTHSFAALMPLLAEHYDVLAIDLPGHGFTSVLNHGDMNLPTIACAVERLLLSLELDARSIVGHSAGAAIALQLAKNAVVGEPVIVGINAALFPYGGALAGLFAPLAKSAAMLPFLPRLIARRAADAKVVRKMLESTGSSLDAAGVDFYQKLLSNENNVAATLQMMAAWKLATLTDNLDTIIERLHLFCGENDQAVAPSQSFALQRRYPDLSVTSLPNVGHLAHEEQPRLLFDGLHAILSARACP